MDSAENKRARRKLAAFTLPLGLFLLLLALNSALRRMGATPLSSPEHWTYPAQTVACGALVLWFWREYELRLAGRIAFALFVGVTVFVLWISPQVLLGFPPRLDGFNPETFLGHPIAYWITIAFRFLRLVVIVPLVEEVFWRGFLLRYVINEKFYTVPVGTFSWLSFALVTVGFGLAHDQADWIAAFIAGALYNCVAYRTKNLASCVLAHAVTNLLLGLWIMRTAQWGFW